ncbi:MAG: DUF2807 domain-containing protein [Croceitalea sp.]|nr:DUF2807 domain-containing protein [Croceitalea sp.]
MSKYNLYSLLNSIKRQSRCILAISIIIVMCACNGDNVPDCFQNAGDLVRQSYQTADFNTITVFENLNLVIKQGSEFKVEVETGEFLVDEISAVVEGDRLVLRNENACNFVRPYGLTTFFVTAPNIEQIRSSTGLLISSDGVLNYPNLSLISESFIEPDAATTDGSFNLNVASQSLSIVVNGIAYFQVQGTTEDFNVTIAAGDSRIEAVQLISQNVNLNHRGSNDVIINPQQSITGIIRGTGNVISIKRPPIVEVEEQFNGRLIYLD